MRDLAPMFTRLAGTYPTGVSVLRFSGGVCAANSRARALLGVGEGGRIADDTVGAAVATLLGRVVAATPFVDAYGAVRRAGYNTLHLTAMRIDAEHAGLLIRAEVPRDDGCLATLVDRFGLTAAEARLALRIHAGLTNGEIAAAFAISVGAVNTRLCRLYRRVGLRGRARLAQLVEQARRPPLPPDEPPSPPPDGQGLDHPLIPLLLAQVSFGLGILDREQHWVWANPLARQFTAPLTPPELALCVAGERQQVLERLRLRTQVWPIGDGLLGLQIDVARHRAGDRESWLAARLGFSRQQARIAVAVLDGASCCDVARAWGLSEASVRAVCAAIHAKLDVHDRTAMVLALSRLLAS